MDELPSGKEGGSNIELDGELFERLAGAKDFQCSQDVCTLRAPLGYGRISCGERGAYRMRIIDGRAVIALKQVDGTLYERLAKVAALQNISISSTVAEAVSEYLLHFNQEKKHALLDLDNRIRSAKQKSLDEFNNLRKILKQSPVEVEPGENDNWTTFFE